MQPNDWIQAFPKRVPVEIARSCTTLEMLTQLNQIQSDENVTTNLKNEDKLLAQTKIKNRLI